MELREFIETKKRELEQKYRSVKVYDQVSVMLHDNCVGEQFISHLTSPKQQGFEVTSGQFPNMPSMPFAENGTQVKFEVIAKGKRKPDYVSCYFLWETKKVGD